MTDSTRDGGELRVGIVIRSYAPSLAGAEIAAMHTAAALAEAGSIVSVRAVGAVPQDGDDDSSGRDHAGFAYEPCDLEGLAAPWPIDVLHLMDAVDAATAAAAIGLARRADLPFIFTPMTDARLWQDPDLIAEVLADADLVCAYSEAEEAQLRELGARRIARVHHGAALVPERDGAAYRRRHSIAADAPLVLFLGRKMLSKGYRALLDALPLVWRQRDDVVAAFLGPRTDPDAEEVFRARRDPRIIEQDQVSDHEKGDALTAADMLCLPSTVDVFPLAVIEAWATRTPLVTARFADAGAVRDEVDGLVTDASPEGIAEALLRLVEQPGFGERLAEAGEARFRRDHDWGALAEQLRSDYASLRPASDAQSTVVEEEETQCTRS